MRQTDEDLGSQVFGDAGFPTLWAQHSYDAMEVKSYMKIADLQ